MTVVIIDLANLYEERQKETDERHYDIVFSVMQGQQQLTLLPVLSSLNADLLVLVGNKESEMKKYLRNYLLKENESLWTIRN